MKKTLFILGCAALGLSMNAQTDIVKEAEKAMKAGKDYTEVLSIITPAMSNPETSGQALTYYIPGKAGFKQYDSLLGKKELGLLKEDEGLKMAVAILGGYDNFLKVLPLDSLPNEKGKIKPKYSKEIKDIIKGHYTDFGKVGVEFYNAKKYGDAYRIWDIFINLSLNPTPYDISAMPDTIIADYMFNRALAAYFDEDMINSAKSFRQSSEYGNIKSDVYQFGLAAAQAAKSEDDILYFAKEGNRLYGSTNNAFINSIINLYLNQNKYDEAIVYLEDAIKEEPDNAQYYALEGLIYDNKGDLDGSIDLYRKSLQKDADNALANYYLGRALCLKAGNLSDNFTGTNYAAYKEKEIAPLFKEAIDYLEKAYTLDPDNRKNILNALEIAYYNTDNNEGLESVKERKLGD